MCVHNRNYNITPTFVFADNVMVRLRYQFYHSFSTRRNCDPLLLPVRLPFLVKAADKVRTLSNIRPFKENVVMVDGSGFAPPFCRNIRNHWKYLSKLSESTNCSYKRDDQSHSLQWLRNQSIKMVLYLPPTNIPLALARIIRISVDELGLRVVMEDNDTICRNYATAC